VIANDILPRFLCSYEPFARFGVWAAIENATSDFLGWFSFRPLAGAGPDLAELGYRLRRAAWGQGRATEGSRALIRRGTETTSSTRSMRPAGSVRKQRRPNAVGRGSESVT
jgi:RimJ/RimL family protein N-acetyltransferase